MNEFLSNVETEISDKKGIEELRMITKISKQELKKYYLTWRKEVYHKIQNACSVWVLFQKGKF
jgi:hypothetical protein